ncbi:hypothetical protein T06_14858 [Trichinella sp. T6]|nr:hypothetical protein T06_14858 [Trichinella sp. T6]
MHYSNVKNERSDVVILINYNSVGGSVVECSPATRATRVRFPADANFYPKTFGHICKQLTINVMQALFIRTLLQKQLRFWN